MKMIGVVLLALAGLFSPGLASAASFGNLAFGDHASDLIIANGTTFSRDYSFHLENNNVTFLAAGGGQHSGSSDITNITMQLYQAPKNPGNLLGSLSGLHSVSFDSEADFSHILGIGDYVLSVFGNIAAGKSAFIVVAAAPNIAVNQTPIPAAGIMFLTALAGLGAMRVKKQFDKRHLDLAAHA